jgi:acetyl esterase/lipase
LEQASIAEKEVVEMAEPEFDLDLIEINPVDDLLTGILMNYEVVNNLTYAIASNYECKLDLWVPTDSDKPVPTLIYIHGGGWVSGKREQYALMFLPFIEMGFAVANVQYRMAHVSPAPSAVQDCRAALRWVIYNADRYGFDTEKLVLFGHSAGAHLALMTGMLTSADGFDWEIPGGSDTEREEAMFRYYADHAAGKDEMEVAAIIEWAGITDVNDLLSGPNRKGYALVWMGTVPYAEDLARSVSPLNYVRPGLPPMLLIHGDADPIVPYDHAVRLHEALDEAGVRNGLVTIPGGGHVRFERSDMSKIYALIRQLLGNNDLMPVRCDPGGSSFF